MENPKFLIFKKIIFILIGLLCFTPFIGSALALSCGIVLALTLGNPFAEKMKALPAKLLSLSIIGLGAGMNIHTVASVGLKGVSYTIVGILGTLGLGYLLGKLLKVELKIATLISSGTAICGGSAIAATAPVIDADNKEISAALITVFVLNACALLIFPIIGHSLNLTQEQFGLWSALAIHDTSSVVGATLAYGPKALEVGATIKMTRALWIIPMAALIAFLFSRTKKDSTKKTSTKKPWFILGFILAATLVTFIPQLRETGLLIEGAAKKLLVFTLFLIGANLSASTLKQMGARPFLLGVILWIVVSALSVLAISSELISL